MSNNGNPWARLATTMPYRNEACLYIAPNSNQNITDLFSYHSSLFYATEQATVGSPEIFNMPAPPKTSSLDMSFSTARDHAIHIRRLYQNLLDEMKCFEAAWENSAGEYYEKNYFLEDMHRALIYLREVMDFRDAPTDAPSRGTEVSNPISNEAASQPQYNATLLATRPLMALSGGSAENTPTNQAPRTNAENATAGPSHTIITLESDDPTCTDRYHPSKGKEQENQSGEAPVQSEVDDSTRIARHRSSKGKKPETQTDGSIHSEIDDSTNATRNRSSKGKERETRTDDAPVPDDDRIAPTTNTEGSTKRAGVLGENNATSDGSPHLVPQTLRRNYTTVGPITADTDRYQAPPNHPFVPRCGTYRLNQAFMPAVYGNPRRGQNNRDESRKPGSPGPVTRRTRRQASSNRHSRSNAVPSSRSGPHSPILDRGAVPRNEADRNRGSHDERPSTGKRGRNDGDEEDGERLTRSQKRSRRG